ncbi:uncharacterized protein LOC123538518 [Mercenaria mercenaria]|uniref:uncharacterized protein LOC123538518 n=1 Tax=Mercenaria mercenaria TaxID=6596 RepID=UPI00234E9BD6|nr:uncharacterized protein LOC123538518 [Mercenaria mercenaria]XP_045178615.2 uncharacterized protein LOC123538518 [Mercenaria mercenaria]
MAASGIAEHNEARRKERTMQKRAFTQKLMMSQLQEEFGDNPDLVGAYTLEANKDTYTAEVNQTRRSGSPPGYAGSARHDAAFVDQMRRDQLRQQQLVEYSAKIPRRFSSKDYVAQW